MHSMWLAGRPQVASCELRESEQMRYIAPESRYADWAGSRAGASGEKAEGS